MSRLSAWVECSLQSILSVNHSICAGDGKNWWFARPLVSTEASTGDKEIGIRSGVCAQTVLRTDRDTGRRGGGRAVSRDGQRDKMNSTCKITLTPADSEGEQSSYRKRPTYCSYFEIHCNAYTGADYHNVHRARPFINVTDWQGSCCAGVVPSALPYRRPHHTWQSWALTNRECREITHATKHIGISDLCNDKNTKITSWRQWCCITWIIQWQ